MRALVGPYLSCSLTRIDLVSRPFALSFATLRLFAITIFLTCCFSRQDGLRG